MDLPNSSSTPSTSDTMLLVITIPGPEVPDVAFPPGIFTADLLPYKKDGPVGSGLVTELNLVLLHDRTALSHYTRYFTFASALHPLRTVRLATWTGPVLLTTARKAPCPQNKLLPPG